MKVSFDYDHTLTLMRIQLIARERVKQGDDVYIISARRNPEPIYRIADSLGIPHSRIFATGSNVEKIKKVKELGIDMHFDDNPSVIKLLDGVGRQV